MDVSERAAYVREIQKEIDGLKQKQVIFGPTEYRTNRIQELSTRIGLKENTDDPLVPEQTA